MKSRGPGEAIAPAPSSNRTIWLLFAACMAVFLVLRFRWIGHLLIWDEAMALCTSRAFAAGDEDPFAAWFWRHPPLHTSLLLVLHPFQMGFAERAELFSIAAGAVNQVLLFFLNRRVFGNGVALWSAFLFALLPGCAFFDVWIKQDTLMSTFGLLALNALSCRRIVIGGFCLGLALLTKGTAVFYCLAIMILWLGGACGKRTLKDGLLLVGVSALTCGWWYLGVLPRVSLPGGSDAFLFAISRQALWQQEWFFYLTQLPALLGWMGISFAVCGAALSIPMWIRGATESNQHPGIWGIWPICLLVPALVLVSLIPNKVPWIVISLFPAWATLAGFAAHRAVSWFIAHANVTAPSARPAAVAGSIMAIAAGALIPSDQDYETILRRVVPNQWRGATKSREIAGVVNEHVRDGERILLTSFHYWKGIPPGLPDPIFTCYLVRKPNVLLRSHHRRFEEMVADIEAYQLDWAVLSPEPGEAATMLFSGFEQRLGLPSGKASGAWLFHTAELHERASAKNTAGIGL